MKIKKISLSNFRGAREVVSLETKRSESMLLYGDNGTGKSSFLGGIEWFITDSLSHLSGEEIKKNEGLRCILSNEKEESFVQIEFSGGLKNRKKINLRKGTIKSSFQDENSEFTSFLEKLRHERLWIRNSEMLSFILKTKSERLADISGIIGYDKVTKTNAILKKITNNIDREKSRQNFESRIAEEKSKIIENLGQMINNKGEFYSAINSLIKNKLPTMTEEIKDKNSLDTVLESLKNGENTQELEHRWNLENLKEQGNDLINTKNVYESIKQYSILAEDIKNNANHLKNISLVNLYKQANKILSNWKRDDCPLCESEINRDYLLQKISNKIKELEIFRRKNENLERSKEDLLRLLQELFTKVTGHKINITKLQWEQGMEEEIAKFSSKVELVIKEVKKDIDCVNLKHISLQDDSF